MLKFTVNESTISYLSFNNFLYAALAFDHFSNFMYNSAAFVSRKFSSVTNFSEKLEKHELRL